MLGGLTVAVVLMAFIVVLAHTDGSLALDAAANIAATN
jgi:hypothetical protein